jgi:hypothetical protein
MTQLEALQQALAVEHEAAYYYGFAGGRAAGLGVATLEESLFEGLLAHRKRRDSMEGLIRRLRAAPVSARLAYPADPTTAAAIRSLIRDVEDRCLAAYAGVVTESAAGSPARRLGVAAMTEAAVRGLRFGATARPLPGLVSGLSD